MISQFECRLCDKQFQGLFKLLQFAPNSFSTVSLLLNIIFFTREKSQTASVPKRGLKNDLKTSYHPLDIFETSFGLFVLSGIQRSILYNWVDGPKRTWRPFFPFFLEKIYRKTGLQTYACAEDSRYSVTGVARHFARTSFRGYDGRHRCELRRDASSISGSDSPQPSFVPLRRGPRRRRRRLRDEPLTW